MAIKITRNEAANCINFVGSTNPAYFNACLSASINSEDSNRIDIINDIRTETGGTTEYEFYAVDYTDFADKDGNAFASAQAAVDYINTNANVASNTGRFLLSATDTIDFTTDQTETTVLLDNGDAYAVNSIRAVANDDGHINIIKHSVDVVIYTDLRLANASIDGTTVTQTLATAVNELNALFTHSGGASGDAPVITSATTVNLTEGDTLNYELVATNGVGYEWSNLPSGVTTVDGNVRKLIGGSSLSAGTYSITAKAINYFGEDTETISLVVATPPFSNTKSVNFQNQDWLGANASLLSSTLGRTANGSGSGDAWTLQVWFKGSTSTSNGQTIFYFGDNDTTNGGQFYLRYQGGNNRLRFRYGTCSGVNYLNFHSAGGTLVDNTWHHILVAYDGGTTGTSSADISSYYGRFSIFIDGVDAVPNGSWSNSNYGWSSPVDADNLRVGRYASSQYLQDNCRVDELAVWNSDQSSNISSIYNSGTPHDLSLLSNAPSHWWRMGDGDTYSVIQDNVGNADFVMYNMTASDIVSDVP
jgi:RES domain-containing protein